MRAVVCSARSCPRRVHPYWTFLIALVCALPMPARAADRDADGMPDDYEAAFQLNPTNALDGALDSDGDGLLNRDEAALGTDPWTADTDRDGLPDGTDPVPVSRAYLSWGDPAYTRSNAYVYAGPPWLLGAWKTSGAWTTSPPAWYASGTPGNDAPGLTIAVDRRGFLDHALLDMDYFGASNASLYLDLYDVASSSVRSNLFGNLITTGNADNHTNLAIPFEAEGAETHIRLRQGSGEVAVYGSMVYPPDENSRPPDASATSASAPAAPVEEAASVADSRDPTPALLAAIRGAADGDTILLKPGTYSLSEAIVLDRALTLRGEGPSRTILRGTGTNRCLRLSHPDSLVEGVTITGGTDPQGGGVLLEAGTLRNCLITGNTAPGGSGGGVLATGPTSLERCDILGNTADFGGGLEARADLTLTDCVVSGNVARVDGGGLLIARGLRMRGSTVVDNRAGRDGGAMALAHSAQVEVSETEVSANAATDGGGANMYHVKDLLGHETLNTLKHYAKLTIVDLKKTHEKCHPRERDEA